MANIKDVIYSILEGDFDYPSDEELNEMAEKIRDLIVSTRLLPADVRTSLLHRIFWVSKILQFFLVYSATSEKELPSAMRPIFLYFAPSISGFDAEYIRKIVLSPDYEKVGMVFHFHTRYRKFLWPVRHLPAVKEKRNYAIKLLPLRRKMWARRLTPPAEARVAEAIVYVSRRNPQLHFVMNNFALGRGDSIKEAADDFVRRWRLLVTTEFSSRLPIQMYIKEFDLQPCGKILVVEYEDGDIRWQFKPLEGDANAGGQNTGSGSFLTERENTTASDSSPHSGDGGGEESSPRD